MMTGDSALKLQLGGSDQRCWTQIGIWGDRSCPELVSAGHCRNCKVYSAGGAELLARAVPDDYLELWATLLAGAKETATGATTPYLAFRVGRSWMALRAVLLREIRQPSVIRSIPHRRHDVLLGVTAVRGDLYPCVSLHSLIGEAPPDISIPAVRFLVVLDRGGDWVVPVDEVSGVYDVIDSSMEHLPATLAHTGSVYTKGIAECGGRPVGLVDEQLLFSALHRRVG